MPVLNPLLIFLIFAKAAWTVKVVSLVEPAMKLAKRDDENILREIRNLTQDNGEVQQLLDQIHLPAWMEGKENIRRFFKGIWEVELKKSFKWQCSLALAALLLGLLAVKVLLSVGSFIIMFVLLPSVILSSLLLVKEFREWVLPVIKTIMDALTRYLYIFSESIVDIMERVRKEEGYYTDRPEGK